MIPLFGNALYAGLRVQAGRMEPRINGAPDLPMARLERESGAAIQGVVGRFLGTVPRRILARMSASRAANVTEPEALRARERLRTAFALHDSGVAMKRAQLRRQDPAASEREIARRLAAWLHERPGAPLGDAEGVARSLADF